MLLDIRIVRTLFDPRFSGEDIEGYLLREQNYRLSADPSVSAVERAVWAWRMRQDIPLLYTTDSRHNILDIESRLIPVLVRMETWGIRIDRTAIESLGHDVRIAMDTLREEIFALAGERFNLASPKQMQEVLFVRLGMTRGKKIKTGYSVDNETLSALAKDFPIATHILDYRSLEKLSSTYIHTLLDAIDPRDGRIHTSYRQIGATTGRMASDSPNLQNIPSGDVWSDRVKSAFIPEQGYVFLVADYSQMELRILANLSGDPKLISAFQADEDIHRQTASFVFGEDTEITHDMRRVAKSINFGVIYGITPFGLAKMLDTSSAEAKRYIEAFFMRYPRVRAYYDGILVTARETGYVETAFGRRRYIPTLTDANRMSREHAEREAINAPVQGTEADIIKIAMIRIDEQCISEGLTSRMLLSVHDELVFEVREEERDRVEGIVRECMEGVMDGPVRLTVGMGWGNTWLAAKG